MRHYPKRKSSATSEVDCNEMMAAFIPPTCRQWGGWEVCLLNLPLDVMSENLRVRSSVKC